MEFKSLLQLKTDQALTAYFPAGLVRGPVIAPKNYGEVRLSFTDNIEIVVIGALWGPYGRHSAYHDFLYFQL